MKLTGNVLSQDPSRILKRLCKHWSHKISVTYDDQAGEGIFPDYGSVNLRVNQDKLDIVVDAPNTAGIEFLQNNIEKHLIPMAQPEEVSIEWDE